MDPSWLLEFREWLLLTSRGFAQTIRRTNLSRNHLCILMNAADGGEIARLDQEHTHENEDQGELDERHERTVFNPARTRLDDER